MQHIINVVAKRTATRALIALAILPIVVWFFAPVPTRMALAYWSGIAAPALGLAMVVGFVALSLRVFWIALAIGWGLTALVVYTSYQGGWAPAYGF